MTSIVKDLTGHTLYPTCSLQIKTRQPSSGFVGLPSLAICTGNVGPAACYYSLTETANGCRFIDTSVLHCGVKSTSTTDGWCDPKA